MPSLRGAEAGVVQHLLALAAGDRGNKGGGQVLVPARADGGDRVGVDGLVRFGERDALDLVAGGFHIGDVDEPGVCFAGDDLAQDVGDGRFFTDRGQGGAGGLFDFVGGCAAGDLGGTNDNLHARLGQIG